jgi:hypothetical protein
MYRKIKEDNRKVVYEYLWGSYKKPYTGLIVIHKNKNSVAVIKAADDDRRPEYAGAYALIALSERNYPNSYTHTAP